MIHFRWIVVFGKGLIFSLGSPTDTPHSYQDPIFVLIKPDGVPIKLAPLECDDLDIIP